MARKSRNTRQFINEMRYMLDVKPSRRMTLEGLVYGEDGEEFMDNGQEEMPQDQNAMQAQQQAIGGKDAMEANPLDEDPQIAQLITNIRVETLQGLTQLANNPESAQYELLKKIFLLIDKAVEDKTENEMQ